MIKGTHVLRIGMKNEGLEIRCDQEQIDELLKVQAEGKTDRHEICGVSSAGTPTFTYLFTADIKTISVIEIPNGSAAAAPLRQI